MYRHFLAILLVSISATRLSAQDNSEQLAKLILGKDSLFWQSYNNCDIQTFTSFFVDNVEFYHDKGGITLGLDDLRKSMTDGLCKPSDEFRLRREAVPGTVNVFPLGKSGVIYGAIISGEHYFYLSQNGKPERRDGWAKFTHLWLKQNGEWKMTRVLSYDHRPAPARDVHTAITLPQEKLRAYEGKYKGTQTALAEIVAGEGLLIMTTNGKKFNIYPEKEGVFFMKERDLVFDFTQKGKLLVKENGAVAEELTKE